MECKAEERQKILSRLLDAVKQCQIRFGGKKELATDMHSAVTCLCQQLEVVLQHGMKQPESNTLQTLRDTIAHNFSINVTLPGASPGPPVMWHYVRLHMTRHEYERYLLLVNINSDTGRGRAWLRSALNENSLERYMHALIGDVEGVARFYEPWSVMSDQEQNAMLPNIAAGLSSILFAISIDRAELNGRAPRRRPTEAPPVGSQPQPQAVVTAPPAVEVRSRPAGRRRRRRVQAHVVSFESESGPATVTPSCRSAPATCLSSPAPSAAGQHAFSFDGGGELEADGSSRSEHSLPGTSSGDDVRLEDPPHHLRPCGLDNDLATHLTPLAQYGTADTTSVSDADVILPDSVVTSPDAALTSPTDGAARPTPADPLSESQLREALDTVGTLRSALTDQVAQLHEQLENCSREGERFKSEAAATDVSWQQKLAAVESRRLTCEMENAVLKHQLRKYVSAVRLLRPGSPHETLDRLEALQASHQLDHQRQPLHADYHAEAEAYQLKLVQVAEMHGELMEFNDRLRAELTRRERQVVALRAELAECGLSGDGSDEAEPDGAPAPPSPPLTRLHCWIPSAFLSGVGNGAHHVYQVYIRIRDEEWNVYHRYSSFNQLYTKMKKEHSEVKEFKFPRKKTLNKKDGRLVEERRRQLQEFLRCVTRALLSAHPELARAPSRAALVAVEPFFGPAPPADSGGGGLGGRLSLFGRSPTAPPAGRRYTGL